MPKSLLEQLPEIVAKGKQEAERILESLEGRHRVGLQTREWVLPAKDSAAHDWIAQNQRAGHLAVASPKVGAGPYRFRVCKRRDLCWPQGGRLPKALLIENRWANCWEPLDR